MNENHSQYTGLTSEEVKARIREGRVNRDKKTGAVSYLPILRRNIFSLFNLVNLILAFLVLLCGSPKNALFMGVVLSNAVIGTWQELRAKRMTDRLTLLTAGKTRVMRDGEAVMLPKEEIVEDDLLCLSSGDQIPVDGLILAGTGQVNEALLTGEADLQERKTGDRLLSGSFLASGHITLKAEAVGEKAFAARIASEARKYKKPVTQIGKTLNIILYAAIGMIPLLGGALYLKQTAGGIPDREAVIHTVAAVIGLIPSGLVLLSTAVLCVGAVRLGKKGALVREYACIETLARVDVLCLDKTGTLTNGKMQALPPIPFPGISREEAEREMRLFTAASQDFNATLSALREAFPGEKNMLSPRKRMDFSSARRYSALEFENLHTLYLGAAEVLCPDLSQESKEILEECYGSAMRVVILASSDQPIGTGRLAGLRPLAFFPLEDEIRPEAAELLREFRENGVEVKLISGDAPETVAAVAKKAGFQGEGRVDMSQVSEKDEEKLILQNSVFGRVSPEQKCRLIKALQKNHTVAMVGDGVNDIPALHQADVSAAMAGGSQAAGDAAKILLTESDFAAMREVLYEGRRAVNNVERSATLYLGKTVYTLLLTLILLFAPGKYPFQPIQLTLISVFTIGIPSVVLGLEPNRDLIRGRFLPNVLKNALPAAMIILGSILFAMYLSEPMKLNAIQGSTLTVLAAANAGLAVLFHTAGPLNVLRGALVGAMTAGLYGAALLMPKLFSLVSLPWYAGLALIILAAGMLILYPLLKKLVGLFLR